MHAGKKANKTKPHIFQPIVRKTITKQNKKHINPDQLFNVFMLLTTATTKSITIMLNIMF